MIRLAAPRSGDAPGQQSLPGFKESVAESRTKFQSREVVARAEKLLADRIGDTIDVEVDPDDDEVQIAISDASSEYANNHWDEFVDDAWRDDAAREAFDDEVRGLRDDEDFIKQQIDEWADREGIKSVEGDKLSNHYVMSDQDFSDEAYEKYNLSDDHSRSVERYIYIGVEKEAEKRAAETAQDLETPEHVINDAIEAAGNAFSEMPISEKLSRAGVDTTITVKEPNSYKVLKNGDDYKNTRSVALAIQQDLTVETARDRGVQIDRKDAAEVAKSLWSGWKISSTSGEGLLIQWATAQELGGHSQIFSDGQEELIKDAAREIGGGDIRKGLEIAKAHIAGTWGATQFVMDKAGVESLPLYRAILVDGSKLEKEKTELVQVISSSTNLSAGYQKVPNINIKRNGAASTAAGNRGLTVANRWNGVGNKPPNVKRVVLRIDAPRESYVSIPVFGQNINDEQEVVLAGTNSWRGWDAWINEAPSFEEYKCCK